MKLLVKHSRKVAFFLISVMVGEVISPLTAFALTGGPSQPEVQSFSPVSSSDMVDLFTGDFSYNIPLMDVDGYPLNLSYSGGITMDQEASWVGLGWNLNPGVINRNMRGIPDDFNGDLIKTQTKMNPNTTISLEAALKPEIFGFNKEGGILSMGLNLGLHWNNYRGIGIDFGIDPGIAGSVGGAGLGAGLGLNFSSTDGFSSDLQVNAGVAHNNNDKKTSEGIGVNASVGYNSRSGLKTLNLGMNVTGSSEKNIEHGSRSDNYSFGCLGYNYTFGTQTYSPRISSNSENQSYSFNLGLGREIYGIHGKYSISGSVHSMKYENEEVSKKSYGYLFAENKEENNYDILLDFNREKDVPFISTAANLPIPVGTYDIFSVSAQGIGGSFRTYRNDFPMFHDDVKSENNAHKDSKKKLTQTGLGIEIGGGAKLKFGVNLSRVFNKTYSGFWDTDNALKDKLNFSTTGVDNDKFYEPGYFKMSGEFSPLKTGTLGLIGSKKLVNPVSGLSYLESGLNEYNSLNDPSKQNMKITSTNVGKIIYPEREKRNTLISYLNADEANIAALDKTIYSFKENDNTGIIEENIPIPRVDENKKGHHLSEITITGEGGQRFVYGIPAYNNVYVENSFSIFIDNSSTQLNSSSGQVTYDNEDNSTNNSKGTERYYTSKTTPAYSHSYLLTGVLSPDFVDKTNNGITDDDLGNATKFSYQRVHDNFRWRVPFKQKHANYQEGNKSSLLDDKASYLYGEKEIWHLRKVEGKNHVAIFEIEERKDAYGVEGYNGGLDNTMKSYKLKKVTLYAKSDYFKNGVNAYPIKTVHFVYEYILCRNVENNDGSSGSDNVNKGKLTLKSLYFTYGKSLKGRLSPYTFNYSNLNPYYNLKGNDRWGTYKPNCGTMGLTGNPNNAEYPYTNQNKDSADFYASAWNLTEIVLPSGGKIQVTYESDDYAYVQDKKAMHMCMLEGFSVDKSLDKNDLKKIIFDPSEKITPFNYVYFKLDKQLSGSNKDLEFRKQYIGDISEVQFNLLAQVSRNTKLANESYEFVKVYAKINPIKSGVTNDGLSGYIYLEPKSILSRKENKNNKGIRVNPIAKGIWQFIRSQTPYHLYPLSDKNRKYSESNNFTRIIKTMGTMVSKINRIFSSGLEMYMFKMGFGSKIKLDKSWVRLQDPDGMKFGGGHRVKQIKMNDDWAAMSEDKGAEAQIYGQEYIYQTRDTILHRTISSGVAAWEPGIGADENPFRMPVNTVEDLKMAPDIIHCNDEPLGENFSPAPIVGYSEVKTIPLIPAGIVKQQTGYTINRFYTAKDSPFKVSYSEIDKDPIEPKIWNVWKKKIYHTTVSQGYLVETNDMHGKPRGQLIFNRHGKIVSGSENIYSFDANNPKFLNNQVKAIKNNGDTTTVEFGVNVDFYSDVRESTTKMVSSCLNFNTDIFNIGAFIIPILTLFPIPKKENRIFQSAVVVKHVNRIGILSKTIAYQENASNVTENLLYDYETGGVLLTSVQNEFHDNIYNFTYPAHWAYDKGMGQAYKNTGLVIEGVNFVSTVPKLSSSNLNGYLVPGDVCLIYHEADDPIICYTFLGTDNNINFIRESGGAFADTDPDELYTVKVIRSGRRNMQSTPIGTVTSLKNPVKSGTLQFDSILNASATEFSDNWKVNCYEIGEVTEVCDSNLDFIYGFNELFDLIPHPIQTYYDSFDATPIYNSSYFFRHYYKEECKSFWKNIDSSFYNYYVNNNLISLDDVSNNGFRIDLWLMYIACACDKMSEPPVPLSFKFISNNNVDFYFNEIARFKEAQYYKEELLEGSPGLKYQFKLVARMNDSSDVEIKGYNNCVEFLCHDECNEIGYNAIINPYKHGLKGNWRKVKDYAFSGDRKYQSSKVQPKRDGIYDGNQYTNFWKKNAFISSTTGTYYEADKTNDKWVWTNEVTLYSPHGPELENRNALNIYSSAVYGFRHTLPLAVASNAKYKQIGFESFEDNSGLLDCEMGHFSFMVNLGTNSTLDNTTKHSGKTSLKVYENQVQTLEIILPDTTPETFSKENAHHYNKSKTDCIGTFLPDSGIYILGAWVKDSVNPTDTSYINPVITVEVVRGGFTTTYNFKASGLIIDGWQRIEGRFTIPDNCSSIRFKLKSPEDNCSWFDDIRVHPVGGNMKSYAYDPLTLRLMADLDENNYATFYEYDLEGNLARLKRETERGIMTIKETKSSIKGNK